MALPFFYKQDISDAHEVTVLDEVTSKHVIQVLRMKPGEHINLTDGKGSLFIAEIIDDHKKKCAVKILSVDRHEAQGRKITIGISLIKNASRFEWFLEKATEVGVSEIIPLLCERTEKQHFRFDRMNAILISAMLQSQQTWLPKLQSPVKYADVISESRNNQKFIAYCDTASGKRSLTEIKNFMDPILLIGPEGDFVSAEVELAISNGFIPVSLGETRLRTETAGIVSATLLRLS